MKTILVMFIMIVSLWVTPALTQAQDEKARFHETPGGFHFGLSEKIELANTVKYLVPFSHDEATLVGTGLCYGPFFSAQVGGRWIADFLAGCALGAVSSTGENAATGGFDIINLLGIQFGLEVDAEHRKPFFTFGINLLGLGEQLLK